MNRLIIATVLLLSGLAMAAEPIPQDETCEIYATMAEVLAKANQEGHPIVTYMKVTGSDPRMREITLMAYEDPRYHSPERQRRVVQDFVNLIAGTCYEQEWTLYE